MPHFPHASVESLFLETALIVVIADSLVAVAALAVAACLKRNPAAAHCVLAIALAWIFVVPLGAVARAVSGISIISLPGPAEAFVSAFEPPPPPPEAVGVEATSKPMQTADSPKALPQYTPSPNRPGLATEAAAPMRASPARHFPRTTGLTLTEPRPVASDARPWRLGAESGTAIGAALGAAWLFGVLFLLTRTLRSYARMRAIRRTLSVLPEESFGPVLDDVRGQLNLVRLPKIAVSDRVWTPCVLGLFRPVITLPADALRNVSARQLVDVLVHEGAHVVRHDCVMALVQKIAGSLFWPHPLIHWLNRRLTSVREEVCDNYVLACTDPVSYGETLLQFAQVVGRERPIPVAAVGMLHGGGSLEQRIAGLIDERRNRHTRAGNFSRALALVAFTCLFLLACGGRGHSQEPAAIKGKIGPQEGTTGALAQTPQLKRAPSAGDDATSRWITYQRVDAIRDPLSKAEIDSVQLVPGKPHTLRVPEEVRIKLGIRLANVDQLAVAKLPPRVPPLVISGSTALDPTAIVRVRLSPWCPSGAVVVEVGKMADFSGPGKANGIYREREIRSGDRVTRGQLLAVFDSPDVGDKQNDLLDARARLKIDDEFLKQTEGKPAQTPSVLLWNARRSVEIDKIAIDRAERSLRGWGLSQKQIEAALDEAEKIKKRGGRRDPSKVSQWGRLEIRSPIDGVVIERNLAMHDLIVDDGINLFQIGNLDKMLVVANLPEDKLAALETLGPRPQWTVAASNGATASGFLTEIHFLVDPNQHTVTAKGYVDNQPARLRAGQFVKATIAQPDPPDVVQVPFDCVLETGQQALVFVQQDSARADYTMQQVDIVGRFKKSLVLRSKPITQGTRLVQNGVDELWQILKRREAAAGGQSR